jgi:thymidylate synthase (FAD)
MIKVTLIDCMGSDLSVVNAARVSFGKKSEWVWEEFGKKVYFRNSYARLSDRDTKLIHYLAKHKHLSPFGHAFASFHVKAPIFVARQLVKHKFLRWNEISRRYVDEEPEFYVPDVWRGRSADKKQGSEGVVDLEAINSWGDPYEGRFGEATLGEIVYEEAQEISYSYDLLIKAGVAPEQARMVLPQSTMTEWYWSGSLDAFAAMCKLRCASDTQLESRIVADQISEQMKKLFPVSWEALMEMTDG